MADYDKPLIHVIDGNGNKTPLFLSDLGSTRDITAYSVVFERSAGTFQNTTEYHDCCEFLTTGTSFTPVTVNDILQVVSSSANDAALGTGTRTVGITYLDESGILSQEIVTLNGTTPVSVNIQASAIISMYALSGGSSPVSAGTINLRNTNTPSIIYEQISIGGNQSQSGRFTCPAGYFARLKCCTISVQGAAIEMKIRTTRNQFDGSFSGGRYLFKAGAKLAAGSSIDINLNNIRLDAGQTVKISGIADGAAATTRIHGSLQLDLIKI